MAHLGKSMVPLRRSGKIAEELPKGCATGVGIGCDARNGDRVFAAAPLPRSCAPAGRGTH